MSTSPQPNDVPERVLHSDAPRRQDEDAGARDTVEAGGTRAPTDRHSVVQREKERYGGIKWGSAFFGWLTATGTAVILTALLVAAGAAVGASTRTRAGDAATLPAQDART